MADDMAISSSAENPEVLLPTDEVVNEDFNSNFDSSKFCSDRCISTSQKLRQV